MNNIEEKNIAKPEIKTVIPLILRKFGEKIGFLLRKTKQYPQRTKIFLVNMKYRYGVDMEVQSFQSITLDTLHEQACANGEYYYRDPESGYIVFTAVKHLNRGYCCKSGCRHCPYDYKKNAQHTPASGIAGFNGG